MTRILYALLLLLILLGSAPAWAACTGGSAGDMLYNADYRVPQYCDGTNWKAMGPIVSPTPPADVTAGLAGHWKLDESSGSAADSSGNGNTGTVNGNPVWQPTTGGKNLGALEFDGVGDFLSMGDPGSGVLDPGTANFTVAAWVKTTDTDGNIIDKLTTAGAVIQYYLSIDGGTTSCDIGSSAAGEVVFREKNDNTGHQVTICSAGTVNDGGWHHSVYTRNGTSRTIYIDGVADITGTYANSTDVSNDGPFRINDGTVAGRIDDARLYNRALSAGEVLQLYQANGGGSFGPITPVAAVSMGSNGNGCAVKAGGTLYCWGYNFWGEVNTSQNPTATPEVLAGGGVWKAVSVAGRMACGIRTDGSAWCWGEEDDGYLGNGGDGGGVVSQVPVSGTGSWIAIDGGYVHNCGIKTDNTLWCWGEGSYGKLGDASTATNLVPGQVSGGGSWKSVSAGEDHTCAIKSDETLWCWGSDAEMQLGNGATTGNQTAPQQIGSAAWIAVSGGMEHTCGVKTDGTAWCWGNGGNGRLGNSAYAGSQIDPVPVAGGYTWKGVSAGAEYSCGIQTDDSIWCWGRDDVGQIGNGATTGDQLEPALVSAAAWKTISAGFDTVCAIKSDNTLWCWGEGGNGDNAQGSWGNINAPAQATGGGAWGFGLCATPDGEPGDIVYNNDKNMMQYCDGTGWKGMASKPPAGYVINGVTFDGTNDWLNATSNMGAADSKLMMGSFWFRRDGGIGTAQTIYRGNTTTTVNAANGRILIEFDAANKLHIVGYGTTGTLILNMTTAAAISDANWHHVVFSFNLGNVAQRAIYIDGAADAATWGTYTNAVIDFAMATPQSSVGADHAGGSKFNGDLADFWLEFGGAYQNLATAANREKFRSAGGAAVYLGATGTTPTGAAVEVLLSGGTSSWHTNDAAGVGFTLNGALTDAATEPSSTGSPSCAGTQVLAQAGSVNTAGYVEGVSGNGSYIFVADDSNGLLAYSFDGATFTPAGAIDPGGNAYDVFVSGNYIFVANGTDGVRAYTHDGSSFTAAGYVNTPGDARDVWTDGAYVYVADYDTLLAYAYDGSSFTPAGSHDPDANEVFAVWGDGAYIYIAESGGSNILRAYSHDGSTLTHLDGAGVGGDSRDLWGDGTYIWVVDPLSNGMTGWTFNGTTLTQAIAGNAIGGTGVWGDGAFIYATNYNGGLGAYTHNGTQVSNAISFVAGVGGVNGGLWHDGTYLYVADGSAGLKAYGGFESCVCNTPSGTAGDLMYNDANDLMQYCNGFEWVGIGK